MNKLCVVSTNPVCQARAEEIAEHLGLSGTSMSGTPDHAHSDFQLLVAEDGLSVKKTGSNQKPLRVDFNTGAMAYRRAHSSRRNEAIARAVGIARKDSLAVVDATAGLGKDSFILAALGCSVIMLERSPVMSLLLQDGLQRAAQVGVLAEITGRMTLQNTEAGEWIKHRQSLRNYVICLDPMFPAKTGSALSRGDMQLMQEIIGADEEFEDLLACARASGADRVVLKRPLRAAGVSTRPTFSIKGKASRFDVFIRPLDSKAD
jgi:16S rRNA (guanine1516-N2)-methyltransferase